MLQMYGVIRKNYKTIKITNSLGYIVNLVYRFMNFSPFSTFLLLLFIIVN